ncbi:hypothetical protein GF312_05275 [Candidatus Poribacteria bacterium]|nr:hypothetical protein [Candidatus Poribacteria bacterium]
MLKRLIAISLIFISSFAAFGQDESTILFYKFDSPFDGEIEDQSQYGNIGNVVGNVEFEEEGKVGGCARFTNGTSISVPLSDSLNPEETITIEFWIMCDPIPAATYWRLIHKGWVGAGSYICGMDNNWMTLAYTWDINNMANVRTDANMANAAVEETWQYYSATYDGEKIILYIDGEVAVQTPAQGEINGKFEIIIAENFSGLLDEIRFSNVALNQDEIRAHMEGEDAKSVDAVNKLATVWAEVKK